MSEAINKEIQRIYDRDGEVRPTVVVKESRPKDAPLHANFEWNNKRAGEKYRLIQARNIIRVAVIVTSDSDEPKPMMHIPVDKGEGSYKPTTEIVKSIDEYTRALHQAQMTLAAARRAIEDLESAAQTREDDDHDVVLGRIRVALEAISAANTALAA